MCTAGVGVEETAQVSKCACVAAAVAGMGKQRTESAHTLAMLSAHQHNDEQCLLFTSMSCLGTLQFKWAAHHGCMYKAFTVSWLVNAAGRTLDMLCQQQPTIRVVQITLRLVQLHQLHLRPCRRPSKLACTQPSTSTRPKPVRLHCSVSVQSLCGASVERFLCKGLENPHSLFCVERYTTVTLPRQLIDTV